MKETLWRLLARVLSIRYIAAWIIAYAMRTPYAHLPGYMNRWWFFNSYEKKQNWLMRRLPSIRVHEILRADTDEHLHDHPWDARTIILNGGYSEECEDGQLRGRVAGDTRAIRFGEYHRIHYVTKRGPTYTLFFTWKYMGTWGFLVDGSKVPWREYLDKHPERS